MQALHQKMWIKKTAEELEELESDNKKDVYIESIFWGIITFLGISIVVKIGYSKKFGTIDPISWNEFFGNLPLIFLLSFIVAVVYWYFKKDSTLFEEKSLICTFCEDVKKDDGVQICECGGTFEDLDTMKWIE